MARTYANVHYTGDDDLVGVPSRSDFVVGEIADIVAQDIMSGSDLYFMPNAVEEVLNYSGRNSGGSDTTMLKIFGVLKDGSKTEVRITDLNVFFDIVVPDPSNIDHTREQVFNILASSGVENTTTSIVEAFPIRGYNVNKKPYIRVTSFTHHQRKKALELIIKSGFDTASDDLTNHFRKLAREHQIPLSDWFIIKNYKNHDSEHWVMRRSPLSAHVFTVSVNDIQPFNGQFSSAEDRAAAAAQRDADPLLLKDRTMTGTLDIETQTGRESRNVPNPAYDLDKVFMICMTFHWKDEVKPLYQVCIVDVETDASPDWQTIVCGDQTNVLKAFALVWNNMAPDIQVGFNDSQYDWNFIIDKSNNLGILGWMFNRMTASPYTKEQTSAEVWGGFNHISDRKIKISAEENFNIDVLNIPGCVCIDVRVCYKKIYPKSVTTTGSSLKFYLKLSKLDSKADMPITKMWSIYDAANSASANAETSLAMVEVANYCIIDAARCQELIVARNIINDYREVSAVAFVSLSDSHYMAGGMKVCNLLCAFAYSTGILTSMRQPTTVMEGKYPGAYVYAPQKGIVPAPDLMVLVEIAIEAWQQNPNDDTLALLKAAFTALADSRPVTGLDFSSLYPSIIMTYNFSPEKFLYTEAEAIATGRAYHPVHFIYNGQPIEGYSIRHNGNPDDIGLFPKLLIELFGRRAELKKAMNKIGDVIELIECVYARATTDEVDAITAAGIVLKESLATLEKTREILTLPPDSVVISAGCTLAEELAAVGRECGDIEHNCEVLKSFMTYTVGQLRSHFDDLSFKHACIKSKQAALKVYMNTFYGEAGNSRSPFFLLQLAGGVTSAGQYNLKLVEAIVLAEGYRIKYGDTDSLYLVAPGRYFTECDMSYARGEISKEEWMAAMVRITMRALGDIRDLVNARLVDDNGTKYLKLAYEEVLYPVAFVGKKKYYGIPHEKLVNFTPKKMFIRGIEVVKQGQPKLAITLGERIMWASLGLNNARSMLTIVHDVLTESVQNPSQWEREHFIKTAAWKPPHFTCAWASKSRTCSRFALHDTADGWRCSDHARQICADCTKFAPRVCPCGTYVCETHKRPGSIIMTPDDPRKYVSPQLSQYNQRTWIPGKGQASTMSFMDRVYRKECVDAKIALMDGRVHVPRAMPSPGERFTYVLAVVDELFTMKGNKRNIKVGDRIEFADTFDKLGKQVDVEHYMTHGIVGLCARFINSDDQFQPTGVNDPAFADEYSQKQAVKSLELLLRSIGTVDPAVLRSRGYAYRRAFKRAASSSAEHVNTHLGITDSALDVSLFIPDIEAESPISAVKNLIDQETSLTVADIMDEIGEEYVTAFLKTLGINAKGYDIGEKTFNTLKELRIVRSAFYLRADEDRIIDVINRHIPAMGSVAQLYQADLNALVEQHRLLEHQVHPELGHIDEPPVMIDNLSDVTDDDRRIVKLMHEAWSEWTTCKLSKQMYSLINGRCASLLRACNKEVPVAPNRAKVLAEGAGAAERIMFRS